MANFFESVFTVLQELAKEKRTMDAMKELQEWVGNNHTELADWAKEAENYTNMFKGGEISEDEYKELMEDLKHSKAISDAADDLAVRSKANEMLDNLIIAAGVML
jgi:predicted glycoside hydrolase/deacetylase ChbG (UPF0249 family)